MLTGEVRKLLRSFIEGPMNKDEQVLVGRSRPGNEMMRFLSELERVYVCLYRFEVLSLRKAGFLFSLSHIFKVSMISGSCNYIIEFGSHTHSFLEMLHKEMALVCRMVLFGILCRRSV